MRSLFIMLAVIVVVSAQEWSEPDVEELVSEPMEPTRVSISRECFERSCTSALGHEECTLSRTPCAAKSEAPAPWTLLSTPQTGKKLAPAHKVASHYPGLVDIIQRKTEVQANQAITMPGIPRKASKSLVKTMRQQDAMLAKLLNMETHESTMEPLHKSARANWIKLARKIVHMPPSPQKLSNERLLMGLAKNLAQREIEERKRINKIKQLKKQMMSKAHTKGQRESVQKTLVKDVSKTSGSMVKLLKKAIMGTKTKTKTKTTKANTAGTKGTKTKAKKAGNNALREANKGTKTKAKKVTTTAKKVGARSIVKKMKKHVTKQLAKKVKAVKAASKSSKPGDHDSIDGVPVGHNHCFERACVTKDKDGSCGVAVITCAKHGKPAHTGKLPKKVALKKVAKLMKHISPFMAHAAPPKVGSKTVGHMESVLDDEEIAKKELREVGEQAYKVQTQLYEEALTVPSKSADDTSVQEMRPADSASDAASDEAQFMAWRALGDRA